MTSISISKGSINPIATFASIISANKGAAAKAAPDPKPPFEIPANKIARISVITPKIPISRKICSPQILKSL